MLSDKLLTLLDYLDRHELNQLRDFICSPFFNTNEDYIRLYDLIDGEARKAPDTPLVLNPRLSKERVWRRLFPKESYNDNKLRRLCSALTQQAFHFLAYRHFTETPLTENVYLAYALNHIKLDKHFRGAIRQGRNAIKKNGFHNSNYHMHQFLLSTQEHLHLEKRTDKRNDLSLLAEADRHLDCYYFSKKLKHHCDELGYKKSLARTAEIPMPPHWLDYLETQGYLQDPAVKAYFLVSQMLQEKESAYHDLKQWLETRHEFFNQEELKSLYTHLMNYCIDAQINRGVTSFFEELFNLYQRVIDEEIIIEKGQLPPYHFKNAITVALRVKAYDWVEHFIETFTDRLPEEEREDARAFNLAKVAYDRGQYDRVIELLREVEYRDIVYALGGKLILLKTFFEQGEFLALDSLIDSFRIYLQRNKLISGDVKRQYLNVLRFVKRLTAIIPGEEKKVNKVIRQIEQTDKLLAKDWLLEKARELY